VGPLPSQLYRQWGEEEIEDPTRQEEYEEEEEESNSWEESREVGVDARIGFCGA